MNQLNDIAPLLSIFHVGWGMILTILIVIFIMCAFLLSYLRKKNVVIATQSNQTTDPPHKVAQKQLNALLKSLTNDPHAIKASYFKLTEILFNYLTIKIQLNLLESTTVEVQRLFQLKKPLSIDVSKDVIQVSKEMDHYKFSQNPSYKIDNIKKTIKEISTIIKGIENDY